MPCWIVLWPGDAQPATSLAWWALQFTPRVAWLDGMVGLEVQGSLRLFGGEQALLQQVRHGAALQGCRAACAAPTAWAARAWLGALKPSADTVGSEPPAEAAMPWHSAWHAPVTSWLDALPLHAMPEVNAHRDTLAPMGCRTLGQVRRLPRGGLSRRFGAAMLNALDRAHGLAPEVFDWVTLPDTFDARLELPGRVEHAEALLSGAALLLSSLVVWLAARQAGAVMLSLHWRHDGHHRDAGPGGHCTVKLASPTRDARRLHHLLAEHLAHVQLAGPVGELSLQADEVAALPLASVGLFAELALMAGPGQAVQAAAQREALQVLLERLSARLGSDHVRLGQVVPDHRPEHAQHWRDWTDPPLDLCTSPPDWPWPQPTWVLPQPKPLGLTRTRRAGADQSLPQYMGPLRLLAGPHRVESGWWDQPGLDVARDYYLALSPMAGLLWVFRQRPLPQAERATPAPGPWFLQGWFA